MQLSNEPAEELARILVDSGKGAFELCGFFAGGVCSVHNSWQETQLKAISLRLRGNGRRHQVGSSGQHRLWGLGSPLAIECSFQYWYEQKQPQRRNFISRHLSYHGNTVTTVSLSGHPARRGPYKEILQHENFHKVSPAYAKRFQHPEETEEQYVERLRQELEDKFLELGPDTVIGCKFSHTLRSNSLALMHALQSCG